MKGRWGDQCNQGNSLGNKKGKTLLAGKELDLAHRGVWQHLGWCGEQSQGCGLSLCGHQLRSALPAVPVRYFGTKASTFPELASGLGAGEDNMGRIYWGTLASHSVPCGFTGAWLTSTLLRKGGQGGLEALGGDAVAGAETAGLVDLHLWGFCTNILYSAL